MKNNYPPFIQFIGTQRSGSNLLRVMLNQVSEISAPHPPHILKTFFPFLPKYGRLTMIENFRALVKDVCNWVNVNPVPWEGMVLSPEKVLAACKKPTLIELFIRIYEMKAIQDEARFCCCKSMENVNYFFELEESGLDPYYLHIFRDGRDVSLSFMKAIVGPKHIYFLAKKWKEEQELALKIKASVDSNRFISVRYEDLIHCPLSILRSICEKLQVSFTNEVMDYFHSHESLNTASAGKMWSNLSKPIIENNFNKFDRELVQEQLKIFEDIAGDMLTTLGYSLRYPERNHNVYTQELVDTFIQMDKEMNDEVLKRADTEELLRRQPQEQLLKSIINKKSVLV